MFGGRVMEQEMFFVPNTPAKSGSAGSGLNPKDRIFGDWETSFGCAGVPREEFGAGECSGGLGMKIGFGGGENLGNCGVEDFVAVAENMSFTELLGIAGCGAPTGEGATQKKHSGGVPDGNGISVPPTPMEKEQISWKKRQQKVVRKKHRPKIFDESKPKRTPKAKPKRETEKRKTARKSSTGQPPGSAIRSGVILETSTPNPQTPKPLVAKRKRKGTTIKASKKTLKSCKRGIDFSSESSIGEQNIADVETVSTIAEELRNQVSDCSSELYANSSHYVDHKAAGSEMKCTVNSPVHSLSLKLEDKTANIYATNVTRAENDLYEKRLTVGNNSLVGSLDNTCKQTFDCAEEARMELGLSSKPLESSLNQNGGKEMMGVINHNGCRSNSLQVYQRRFRANEPIKNIRKLGPNCPKPYKGMRTKRKKRTVMYNLWFLEEVSEQKVIAPRYALCSNFKQRSDDPKLSVLPTKSQIEASMVDQESFKCSLSLFAIVKSKRKRSKRKRSKKISNVDSFPHVSTKRKRSNLMPKQCLPSSNTITHNSHNNLTSVSETLSIRRTVALNLEACAEIPVYPPQCSQAKVEKLHPPPPPCPGMSLQEYLYPTAQGSQSKLTCHLLSEDGKYIGWHPKEAFIPTTSKHIEWHRKEAFTPTSSMLIERHPKEAFTPTTKSLHAKVDKLHSSPLGSSLQNYQRLWPIVQSTSCRTSKPFTADSHSKFRVSTHHLQDSSHEKVKLSIHPPHLCSSSQGSSKTKVETRRLRHRNTLSDIEFRQQDCFPIAQGSLVKFTKSLESNIQQLEKQLEKLQISDEYGQLVVRDTNIHGAVTPYKDKSDPPKRRKLPKVDLDSESIRRWNMLMETDASELPEDVDEEKKKDWDEQEKVFHKRLEGFITFMHVLQGDRRFSPWKGSVVDSVVGVFLTQNVSDYLSSNAFMSLAAKYPAPSRCSESDVNYLCSQESTIGPNSQHSHETFIYSRERENEVVVEHPSTFENSTALKETLEFEQTDNSEGLPQEVELPSCGSSDDTRLCDCENGIITPSTEILEDPNRADISLSLSASVHNGCISSLDGNLGFGCDFGEDKNKNSDTSEDVNKNYGSKNGCARVSSMLEEVAKVSANSNTSLNELEVAMEDTVLLNNTCLEENTSFGSNNGCASKSGVLDEVANASGNSNTSLNELEVTREDIVLLNNTYLEENTPSGSENGCTSISGVLEEAAKGSANSNTSLNELQVAMEDNTVPLNNTHPEENTSSDSKNGCASISSMLEEVAKASSNSNTLLNELVAPEDNTVSLNNTHQQENMSPKSREKRGKVTKTPIPEAEWEELRKTYYNPNRTPGKNLDSIDWDAVRCAPVGEIAKVIETRGMNNVLAAKIKAFLNRLAEHHDSIDLEWLKDVPPEKAKEFLLSIRGVGLKSTECVRLLTLGHHAFPVDTNIARIVVRLGWVPLEPLPGDLQIHLLEQYPQMDAIQKYLWPRLCTLDKNILYVLHYQLITFGKVICTKKNPNCNACPMRAECRHFASAFARSTRKTCVATTQGQARDYGVSKSHMRPPQPVLPHIERDIEDFPYGFTDKDDKRCTQTREPAIEMRDIEDFPFELDNKDEKSYTQTCEPIIEVPASPEPESTVSLEIDADIIPDESKDEDEIPHIKLDTEEFKRNLLKYLNPEFEVEEVSNALVALTPKATTIPAPKIKSVERLRTRHRVYTLPDSHPLLAGFEPREYDDPCPYLLAIWPKESLNRKESSSFSFVPCDGDIDSPGNASQETTNQTVCGTILIPCRTANKGSFPLNGTYFQVNEVFADHETSECPINVPRKWIWSLAQRNLYCGSTASAIARGMEMDEIQQCFWNGFVCVRAFDRKTRDPVHLSKRFHELPSSVVGKKKVLNDE